MARKEIKRPPEYRFIDATAHTTAELSDRMDQLAPLITSLDSDSLTQYIHGEIHHMAFDMRGNHQIRNHLINAAIQKAKIEGTVPFSEHGNLHETHQEALHILGFCIEKGHPLSIQKSFIVKNIHGKDTAVTHYLIDTPQYPRDGHRPFPLTSLQDIYKRIHANTNPRDQKQFEKIMRREVKSHGVAFGIVALIYDGYPLDKIMNFFKDKHLRKDLEGQKYPTTSRSADFQTIADLINLLTREDQSKVYPSRNPADYKQARQILKVNQYVDTIHDPSLKFEEVQEHVIARLVLVGSDSLAHQTTVAEGLYDNHGADYIQRHYGRYCTSIVATAYIHHLS